MSEQSASTSMVEVGGPLRKYWNKIWAAKVPANVRMLVWRLVHGIVPTRSALILRHVHIMDVACVFCKSTNETSLHVFKECAFLQSFWRLCPLGLNSREHAACGMKEWIFDMIDIPSNDQLDLFFMALWSVWIERNKIVWNDGSCQPMYMIQWCMRSLEEFQKYHPKATNKKKRRVTKWQCPPKGRLKINIDGAYKADTNVGGIGVIVRDDLGIGIAAIARPFQRAHSMINMEAEACRAGLLLSIHQGWTNVVIESDSALLITALQSREVNFSETWF
ncbi:uncharacterized protein LOC112194337 [Rosa chinensis]|uniref:uncharacterized protein LOC112194337 n=1 Tax=Rosa chinensis TaxID=74649 RepID=UPI000D090209|nr:uncharacterized protein LOC112194337 [Rosa chinensis]